MVNADKKKKNSFREVFSWALWDWGTSAFSVLITTFVFARYIVSDSFIDPAIVSAYNAAGGDQAPDGAAKTAYLTASADLTSALGWALAIGGVLVAVIAPIVGQRTDRGGQRRKWLGINTLIVIALTLAMFFVDAVPTSFIAGITLLALATVFYEMANVNYNAMLLQVSTPQTVGRVSGFGWGMGYVGGIVVLLIALAGFILGEPPYWFGITDEGSMNIRVIVLLAAIWSLVFSIPAMVFIPENNAIDPDSGRGIIDSYRIVFQKVRQLRRDARSTFYFLWASAIYRDGLAGVFTFGGILAGKVFGLSDTEVILFAVGGNLVAGIGVFVGGVLDDRFSPRAVIIASLSGLIIAGTALFILHDGGSTVFWVGGLALTFFVGPAQASSRTLIGKLAPQGAEGELFGLYATTGRAISFLTPALFGLLVGMGKADYWGILGIVMVLLAGLLLLLPIRTPSIR
jgi:UMF1 family MFS transporter